MEEGFLCSRARNSKDLEGDSSKRDADSPLYLHSFDHPGLILVTISLNDDNYLSWSRAMKLALKANIKLGFINGRCQMPKEYSLKYDLWCRADSMVTSWILNTISKDIVDAYLYASSAYELWKDLEKRYGQWNGSMSYKLQREISSMSQGNSSTVRYFTSLKKLWDEFNYLMVVHKCGCGRCIYGFRGKVQEVNSKMKLMQFLQGLNESYDNLKNQILVMEPLSDIDKAYSMF